MDTRIVVPVLLLVVIVLVAAYLVTRRRRSEKLKQQFGPEYERAVRQHGDASRAETVLQERARRVEKLSIRPLSEGDREAYAIEWSNVQRRFVDEPSAAVGSADRLVARVMTDRGYPVTDFERSAEDISVSYPQVVQNYRAAHDIYQKNEQGTATTEELRRAMVHYRSLFEELLGTGSVRPINGKKLGVVHERAS